MKASQLVKEEASFKIKVDGYHASEPASGVLPPAPFLDADVVRNRAPAGVNGKERSPSPPPLAPTLSASQQAIPAPAVMQEEADAPASASQVRADLPSGFRPSS